MEKGIREGLMVEKCGRKRRMREEKIEEGGE